jgi:hypothetical protein
MGNGDYMLAMPLRENGVRTTIFAALTSGGAAAVVIVTAVYLRFGVAIGPHQQFAVIALVVAQEIIALALASVFAIVQARGGDRRVVNLTAAALALLLIAALCVLEVLGLLTLSDAASLRLAGLLEDAPFLGAIVAPGLVTILIQRWLFVRSLPVGRGSPSDRGISAGHE